MNKVSCIYTITNLVDGKIYVGFTNDFYDRSAAHISMYTNDCHSNDHLQNAVNKYGLDKFKIEILEEYPENMLPAMEHYWANLLSVHNDSFGYNIKPTNPLGRNGKLAEETKRKITLANKGRKQSAEFSRKLSERQKGQPSPKRGKKYGSRPKNINDPRCRKIYQLDKITEDIIQEWPSAIDAAEKLKINRGNISNALTTNKNAGGYKWKHKI